MKIVITHSGKFHPDDVFAVATIMLLEGKENIKVIRSRDQSVIDTGDFVVDVGREYNYAKLRFDHHQPGAPVRENKVDYAAFGLVWKHYGEQVCGSVEIAEKIEESLVLPIDAGDVGISLFNVNEYEVHPAELFHVIDSYLPPWDSDLDMDIQFLKAVDFAYDFLLRKIEKSKAKLEMKKYALELYASAEDKRVLISAKGISTKFFIDTETLAVLSPDSDREGVWLLSVVPAKEHSFEYSVLFPESWASLQGDELVVASGIEGSEFCHKNRFLFVGTKEAALEAAKYLS